MDSSWREQETKKKEQPLNGSCLCGRVRFRIEGSLPDPDACHCQACRKWSGHFLVSADIPKENLHLGTQEGLRWYQSSAKVRRGFCQFCGSSLFWDPPGRDWIGVALGSLDQATGAKIAVHIFVAEKADYYQLEDGIEQKD